MIVRGLVEKYFHVRDQILASPVISNFTSTCSTFLRVPYQPFNDIHVFANDSFALASQRDDRNRSRKPEKWHHKCDHSGKLGHKIDRCYVLHGRPPQSTAIAKTGSLSQPYIVDPLSSVTATDKSAIINEFLKGVRIVSSLVP